MERVQGWGVRDKIEYVNKARGALPGPTIIVYNEPTGIRSMIPQSYQPAVKVKRRKK